ncbi:MAG TPA: hypothetical protein VGN57_05405 [Pirellulaceae bacterium]|jgi:hypothetical protein|nr:hypothetical protein [Pirellulaceae bacterium]
MKRAVIAIAAILCGSLVAQASFAADPTPDDLVQALGSPDFNDREFASERLLALGLDAKGALDAGVKSSDREIRYRCLRILAILEEKDFVRRLQAFENGQPSPDGQELPMWPEVRERFGDEAPIRKLFAEMTREERELLAAAAKGAEALEPVFDQRLADVQFELNAGQAMKLGTAAAFLLAADVEDFHPKQYHFNAMNSLWHQQTFRSGIEAGKTRVMLRALASDFIVQMYGPDAYTGLHWAMQCDLPAGVELARKTLDNERNAQEHVTQHAMLTLAKFGDKKDIVHLEPFFTDEATLHQNEENGRHRETQIRDLAAVVTIHLLGRGPEEFGFGKPIPHPTVVFNSSTVGFFDAESRKKSFAALEAFRKNGTEPAGFDKQAGDHAPDDPKSARKAAPVEAERN